MGKPNRPKAREGRVITESRDGRWCAQLELDERTGKEPSRIRLDVPGTFASEASARGAAQGVLNEWCTGHVSLRDLVLRELAAVYRRLRERHKTMEPVAVPTTSTAWERALALWELAGWMDAEEAARYQEHARRAFDTAGVRVTRHKLADSGPDPTQ